MGDLKVCEHAAMYWTPVTNEDGWRCADCGYKPGEEPGYSPEHDRADLRDKVDSLLHYLHEQDLVSVSNGSEGEGIVSYVTSEMREAGTYDQQSIIVAIVSYGRESHAKFWKERGDSIVAGRDNRERCHCGKIATSSISNGDGTWRRYCSLACEPADTGEPF